MLSRESCPKKFRIGRLAFAGPKPRKELLQSGNSNIGCYPLVRGLDARTTVPLPPGWINHPIALAPGEDQRRNFAHSIRSACETKPPDHTWITLNSTGMASPSPAAGSSRSLV